MNYREWCNLKSNDPKVNIFPKPTSSDEAIHVLIEYLLGKDWYVNYSCGRGQVNTEMISEILLKYPSEKYNRYPWYKKLWLKIKCLFTSKYIWEYY